MKDEQEREHLRQRAKHYREFYRLNGPTIQRTEKVCARCHELKPIAEFPINKDRADWHGTKCKPCNNAVKDEWRKANPEKARAASYRQFEKSKELPDEKRLKYSRRYYQSHKQAMLERTNTWKRKNRKRFNAYMLAYHKQRMASDSNYAFAFKIRSKIRLLLKGYRKSAPTEQLLGCKIADFKRYLESLWEPWMSWSNYGKGKGQWCIDHIVPVDAFDFNDPHDQRACFHFTNLRPLCRDKNREKWHKFDPAALESLRSRVT